MSFIDFHNKSNLEKLSKKPKKEWPASWKIIHHKEYPRFKQIKLEKNTKIQTKFTKVITKRISERKFSSKKFDIKTISKLFFVSAGIRDFNEEHRHYPSAGRRYPLEVYLVNFGGKLGKKIFHYNVIKNSLEEMWEYYTEDLEKIFFFDKLKDASGIIIITAIVNRSSIKYGERGYRYALLEAGHLGQNFLMTCTALGMTSYPIGSFVDKNCLKLLDLDETEIPVYAIAFGG